MATRPRKSKAKPQDYLEYVDLQKRLTVDGARQLAQDHPHRISLTLGSGWDTTAALDALLEACGPRLETLSLRKEGKDFWPWLARNPPLRDAILPGTMIPDQWSATFLAPTGMLWFTGIPKHRTSLDLSVFPNVRRVQLDTGGHVALRLNGQTTFLYLNGVSAEPDETWASLLHLGIASTQLDLTPLLAAAPALESLALYWRFRLDNLEPLLLTRHWKSINIVGDKGMPTEFISRLWDAGIADEIKCRHFPGPFMEETFTNGKWEGYCTR